MSGGQSPTARLLRLLCLLWLTGISMRITILAVPPVIPLIHADLHMSEAQVGFLVSLPLLLFAVAAVPGALLVHRLGTFRTLTIGMAITALAAAGRGGAHSVWTLYAATLVMGFGVAIMQPALPALVREWLPQRIALGAATSTNGLVMGGMLAPALSFPLVLPLVGNSWRLDLIVWAAPVLATALIFIAFAPRRASLPLQQPTVGGGRWWPDWRSPLVWLLGLTFGSNNAMYFGTNAFVPDYLVSHGRADLIGPALVALNGAQLVASLLLLLVADRLQSYRALPYLVFGPISFLAALGLILSSGAWIAVWAGVIGFSTAITFAVMLALPPLLSRPGDVHRTAAGMFTISYTCAVVFPTASGALWDLTGVPWTAFVALALCAIAQTILGMFLSRQPGASTDDKF
ncbi:MAG TPA: MFS transporter [Xanthomonadaceae bacterium]|nr:MFS transporter [Xanthomonadaceae bacterium]